MSIIKWYDQTQKAIKTNRKYQSHTCYYYKYCCFGSLAVYLWQFCFRFNPLLRFGFKILGIRFSLGVRLLVLMVNVRGKRLWENVKVCVMMLKVESSCRSLDMWPSTQEEERVEKWVRDSSSAETSNQPAADHGALRCPQSVSVWNQQAGADPERPARLHEVGSERIHSAVYLVSEHAEDYLRPPHLFVCVFGERPHTRWLLPNCGPEITINTWTEAADKRLRRLCNAKHLFD